MSHELLLAAARASMKEEVPNVRVGDTVQLHPEATTPLALVQDTDFYLEPIPSQHGTYQRVVLYSGLSFTSTLQSRFGRTQLGIAGDWGFASIPAHVRRATAITAASWVNRAVEELAISTGDTTPREFALGDRIATWDIPLSAKRMLGTFTRWSIAA